MQRRRFCKTIGAATASLPLISSGAMADDPDFPVVSTRGHFDGSIFGTDLADGYSETEYELTGDLAGYTTDEQPEELIVWVHGAFQDAESAKGRFPKQIAAMQRATIDGEFLLYSWDADLGGRVNWWQNAAVAEQNGPKLASFLAEYKRRSPETTVRVVGMSLGCRVVPVAADTLEELEYPGQIDTATLLGAAISAEDLSLDGRFGSAVETEYGVFQNFMKTDDKVLNWMFANAEQTAPLGSRGAPDPVPNNYVEFDVTDAAEGHNSLWKYDTGAIDRVGESWS